MKISKLLGFVFFSFLMCTNVMGAAIAPNYTEDELRVATSLAQDVVNFWYSENGRVMFDLFAVPATRNMFLNSPGLFEKRKYGYFSTTEKMLFNSLLCLKVLTEKRQIFAHKEIQNFMPKALNWYFICSNGWVKSIPKAQKLVHATIDKLTLTNANKWNLDSNPTKQALAQMLQWILYASLHHKISKCFEDLFEQEDILTLHQKATEIIAHKREGIFSLINDGIQPLLQIP